MVIGFIGFLPVSIAPLVIGSIIFDTNTMLIASAAIVVGLQSVGFGVFARTFAARTGLLPAQPLVERITRILTFEAGFDHRYRFGIGRRWLHRCRQRGLAFQ